MTTSTGETTGQDIVRPWPDLKPMPPNSPCTFQYLNQAGEVLWVRIQPEISARIRIE